jgi:hypothetical protein
VCVRVCVRDDKEAKKNRRYGLGGVGNKMRVVGLCLFVVSRPLLPCSFWMLNPTSVLFSLHSTSYISEHQSIDLQIAFFSFSLSLVCMCVRDETRQDNARQRKTRQGNASQRKTRQDKG